MSLLRAHIFTHVKLKLKYQQLLSQYLTYVSIIKQIETRRQGLPCCYEEQTTPAIYESARSHQTTVENDPLVNHTIHNKRLPLG